MTIIFSYQYIKKVIKGLSYNDLLQLIPKKWKKQIQEKSFIDFVGNLDIVKTTPVLNYFIPILSDKIKENMRVKAGLRQLNIMGNSGE
jgi:hypothetical protein